jgi:glycosyltransferase involved in cell wall biosynthesis
MPDTPRVSVLMTVYNAAPWLREAVDSIVAQTFTDWELVAVENGSSDASPQILASYADPRIRVITVRDNMGRTPALRHAFDLARGEYFAVLDADDVAAPTRLAKQVAYLDANPDVSLVGTWTRRIDGEGRDVGRWEFPTDPAALRDQLGFANPIVHSAAMYRAALAREVGGYPAEYPYAQDSGLWLRLCEQGGVGMIPEYLSTHRTLAGGMTRSKESRVIVARDLLALLEYAGARLPLSPSARRRNREERTIAALRYAIALIRAGRPRPGVAVLARAIVSDPATVLWNRVYRDTLTGREPSAR